MVAQQLYSILQQQYQDGYIDVSQLEDISYTLAFNQLGIPYSININDPSNTGWEMLNENSSPTLRFSGVIDSGSVVLGLPATTPLEILFLPVEGTNAVMKLRIDLHLPSRWVFGQSFGLLDDDVYDNIRLESLQDSTLIVQASRDYAGVLVDEPALLFSGYIDQNSSVFTALSWFISGGIQNPVNGPVNYIAETGAVDMNLALASGSVADLFGNGSALAIQLVLYSGLNSALNLYEMGVALRTTVSVSNGAVSIPMSALYTSTAPHTVTFGVGELDFNFQSAVGYVEELFGHSDALTTALPSALAPSDLVVKGLSFRLGLDSLNVQYAWMGVSALENTQWVLWENVLALSNINLDLTIYNPLGDYSYRFLFSADTIFGSVEDGLPMTLTGELPGLTVTGSLNAVSYNLAPLIAQLFGNDKGLPDEIDITRLDFSAGIYDQAYSFDIVTVGNWAIPFGTDNELVFERIEVSAAYDSDNGPSGRLLCDFAVNANEFKVELDLAASDVRLYGAWANEDAPIDYQDIAIALGLYGLPNIPPALDLSLTAASFELEVSEAGSSASFALTSANYGSAALVAGKDENGNWGFIFGMHSGLELSINLTDIDVVGNFVPEGMDVISINNLRFVGATTALPPYTSTEVTEVLAPPVNSGLVLSIDLNIGSLFSETFSVRYGGLDDGSATDTPPENEIAGGDTLQLDEQQGEQTTGAAPGPTSTWISVQRAFGPVHIARIGFRINDDQSLSLLIDGDITLAGLSIALMGLEADIPPSAPYIPSFSLAGLEVGYVSPGLTIAGALVKSQGTTATQYTGELIFQAGNFGASAFGSYTTVNGNPSLFAFLAVNAPIGGPPFCVVTGLAAGFGYNRKLILPTIETVQTYPLVQAAMGITDPQATIAALDRYIVPAQNQYWLAAGIRFTSFEMLNAYALLTASFGTQVELALMGEALLTLPITVPGEQELILAQADMVLLASINPSLGQIALEAQLTSRSYVLDRSAKVTGGFALYFWFGNSAHKGDFVISLGGYNPHFTLPAYYPRVPLLGLNWQVSSVISIKGGLYCAVTPSVIMAGGNLSASYALGDVKAWFTTNADFLIRFKPFYFEATMGITVGASYKMSVFFTTRTYSVSVSASLKLWGPAFAGTATVDLTVMTFTFSFGPAKRTVASAIAWPEFRTSFLPPEPGTLQQQQRGTTNGTQSLIRFNAENGLLGTFDSNGTAVWRMDPGHTVISFSTAIPSKQATLTTDETITVPLNDANTNFGIGPMQLAPSAFNVTLAVTITRNGTADNLNSWSVELVKDNIPTGLWLNTTNSMNGDALVKNALCGLRFIPLAHRADKTVTLNVAGLLYYTNVPNTRTWNWSPVTPPSMDYFAQGMSMFQSGLQGSSSIAARNGILDVLNGNGLAVYTHEQVELDGYISNAQNILYAAPRICYLGETSNTSSVLSMSMP